LSTTYIVTSSDFLSLFLAKNVFTAPLFMYSKTISLS
jgi:hypothetical protein